MGPIGRTQKNIEKDKEGENLFLVIYRMSFYGSIVLGRR